MKNIFKILILILVGLSVASCELFSPNYWNRVDQRMAEKGTKCYRDRYGNFYCEDTNLK